MIADTSGKITIDFSSVTGLPMISGLEILPVVASSSATVTAYDAPLTYIPNPIASASTHASGAIGTFTDPNPFDTASDFSATIIWGDGVVSPGVITGSNGSFTISGDHEYELGGTYQATVKLGYVSGFGLGAASSVTSPSFVADTGYQGGITSSKNVIINTAFVPNAAPQSIYQGARYGNFNYTIPNFAPNALYQVRLDFAETQFHTGGQRLFNVAINGNQVLSSFDVFSAAGGSNVALGESFLVRADGSGVIKVSFTGVLGSAMVSGIEVAPASSGISPITVQGNQLTEIQEPSGATAGITLAPVVFQILDDQGNPVASTTKVTITANGPGGFTPDSETSVYAVNGVATFTNLRLTKAGSYTLTATANGDQPGTTDSFTVSANTADHLAILQGPTRTLAGQAISPGVTVAIDDAYGNLTTSTANVTISATGNSAFTGASTTTVAAINGIATFSNLILTKTGSYTLTASSSGLGTVASSAFSVTPNVQDHVAWLIQPANGVAGTAIGTVSARIEDAYGNLTNSTANVILSTNGPGTFTAGSVTTQAAIGGIATFTGLTLNTSGAYTINAASAGVTTGISSGFMIQPAAATHLQIVQSPGTTVSSSAIAPVTVNLLDIFNNISLSNASVTVTATGPGGFTNASTLTVNAVNGVATFSNLILTRAGSYTLSFSSNGLTGITSASFNVIAANVVVTTLTDAVTGLGNDVTLRQALIFTNLEGGTPIISFSPGLTGSIILSSALGALPAIATNINLTGPGANVLAIDGGQFAGLGIFTITAGTSVKISGLTLANASAASGGAINNQGTLSLANVYLTNNTATQTGGAISNASGASLTVTGSTFSKDSANAGGAVFNASGASATLTTDTFTQNKAVQGGAIYNAGTLTATNDTIANNIGTNGGGIGETTTATTNLGNSIVSGNLGGDISGVNPTPFNNAVSFNGSNDFVQLPTTGFASFSNGFSAGLWAYPTVAASSQRFFDFGNGAGSDNIILFRGGTSNDIYFQVYKASTGTNTYLYIPNAISMNQWQYFSVTLSSSGIVTFYKNGVAIASGPVSLPDNTNRVFNYIGKSNWSGDGYYAGLINDVSVWNRALSPAEVKAGMTTVYGGNETGLVGYWPMNEGAGTTVYDKSSSQLNGSFGNTVGLASVAVSQPSIASALSFNGSNQYVQLPSTGLSNFTTGFSFGVWAYPTAANSQARFLDIGNGSGSDNILFYRSGTSNDLIFQVFKGSTGTYVVAPNALTLNTWQYLSVTQSSTGAVTIYKNGVAIATGTVSVANNIARANDYIGKSNWNDPTYAGLMQNASIWNVSLSAAQVQNAMTNGLAGNETGLVAYYPMTTANVSGTALTDQSANHRNATLVNGLAVAAFPKSPYTSALSFNGQTNYVQLPSTGLANFTNGFSAGIWVNTSTVTSNERFLEFSNGINSDNIILMRNGSSNDLLFYVFKGSSAYSLNAPSVLVTNLWQYLAVTQNSAGLVTLYVNGIAVASSTLPLANNVNRTSNYVAKSNYGDQDSLALMNGFSVWNVGLTASQVQSAMTNGLTGTESGLVGYWPMNETSGTTVYDLSPNKLDGSMNGYGVVSSSNVVSAKFSSALTFNGNNGFVQLPSAGLSNFTGGFSFGVWAFPTLNNGYQRFFDFGNGAGSDNILLYEVAGSNDLGFQLFKGGTAYGLSASNVLTYNQWQYVAVTQTSAGVVTLYINGNAVASSTLPVPNNLTRATNYIGKSNWSVDPNYVGEMTSASIWNTALTAAQLQNAMNNGLAGNEAGLVSYYPMTSSTVSGVTVLDSSPNHHDASLNGYGLASTTSHVAKFASDLNFNGSNSYVQLPSTGLSNFTNGFSFGVWAYPTAANNQARFLDIGNGSGSDNILFYRSGTSNDLIFQVFKGGTGTYVVASNALTLNTWQYLSVTQSASGAVTIYKNGQSIATGTVQVANNITRTTNYIGKSNWGDPFYAGEMSSAGIWNVALTAAQVQSAMNNGLTGNEAGLVAYYPMTAASISGMSLLDSSPNHNDASINGGTMVLPHPASPYSAAVSTNGQNDYIQLPATGLANFTNGFSAGVWFNPTAVSNNQRIFDFGNGANSDNIMLYRSGTSNDLLFSIFKGGSGYFLLAPNVLTQNTWQYFSVTQNSSGVVTIAKNGVTVATSNAIPLANNLNRAINYLGASNWGDANSSALMSGFSVWNVGLTPAQVQNAMNNGLIGNESGLVAYYPLNETSGTILHDLSTNQRNAAWNGGVSTNAPGWAIAPTATASASFNSLGHNLIGSPGIATGFAATDQIDVNPQLGTLGYYGGTTPTMPFLTGPISNNTVSGPSGTVTGLIRAYTGDNTAKDSSGNQNGTWYGTTAYAPGPFGQAFRFNGASDLYLPDNFIPYPTSGTSVQPMSISLWFQSTGGGVILGQIGSGGGHVPAVMIGTDGHLYSQLFWGNTTNTVRSPGIVNDGQYHYVAVSYDGSTQTVYLDGRVIGSTSYTVYAFDSWYYYRLGGGYSDSWPGGNGGWYFYNGQIADFGVFDKALTPADIQVLMTTGLPRLTPAITDNSLAIGAIPTSTITTDQRGFTLPASSSDIGAFQNQITGTGVSILATSGVAFSGPIASFVDADISVSSSTITAAVNWGDGTAPDTLTTTSSSAGQLVLSNGVYTVQGNHTYASAGTYAVSIKIADGDGNTLLVRSTDVTAGLNGSWLGNGNTFDNASANNGVLLNGASYGPGLNGGRAFSFDGTNQAVDVGSPSNLTLTTAATLEAWIYPTGAGLNPNSQGGIILGKEGEYQIARFGDGTIRLLFANTSPGGSTWINTGYVALANQWTHIAVTYNNGVITTYINSVQANIYNGTGAIGDTDTAHNDFEIGGRQASVQGFQGLITGVMVYNTVLSQPQVQSDYLILGAGLSLAGAFKGEGTAADASGNGLTGTVVSNGGFTYSPGVSGDTFTFNGTLGNYVDLGTGPDITGYGAFAVEAWIKTTSGNVSIIQQRDGNYWQGYYLGLDGYGRVYWQTVDASANAFSFSTNESVADGVWHLIVATRNDVGVGSVYIDGKLEGQQAAPAGNLVGNTHVYVGQNVREWNGAFNGSIDEVKIYRNNLSPTQIAADYQKYAYAATPLLGEWQGDGNTADSTGQSAPATLVGGVTYTTGVSGQAFKLNGTTGYVNLSPTLGNFGYGDFTASAWVQTTSTQSGYILAKRSSSGHGSFWNVSLNSAGKAAVEIDQDGNGTSYNTFASTKSINDGKFHDITVVRHGATLSLYIDGQLDSSQAGGLTYIWNTAPLLAGVSQGYPGYFTGNIDDISIDSKALSPYEILTNYNAKSALATSQKPVVTVAAPLTVNTTSDSANPGTGLLTLRQAIALAEGNAVNTIQFAPTLNGQIITLNSGITITGNVNIVGPGSGNLTIYDAGTGTYGSFVVNPGVKASVSGLTFSGGFA